MPEKIKTDMKKIYLIVLLLFFFSCKRTDPCPDEDMDREVLIPEDARAVNPYEGNEKIRFYDLLNNDTFQLIGQGIKSYWEKVKTHSPNIQCQRTYNIESVLLEFKGSGNKNISILFRYDPFSERPDFDRIWISSNICVVTTYDYGSEPYIGMDGFNLDSIEIQGVKYLNVVGITNQYQGIYTDTVYVSKKFGIIKIKSPKGIWELLPL